MKKIIAIGLLLASCSAFADTGELVCAYNDNNDVSPATAVKNLNKKLEKLQVKAASQPVFLQGNVETYVCVTVTK